MSRGDPKEVERRERVVAFLRDPSNTGPFLRELPWPALAVRTLLLTRLVRTSLAQDSLARAFDRLLHRHPDGHHLSNETELRRHALVNAETTQSYFGDISVIFPAARKLRDGERDPALEIRRMIGKVEDLSFGDIQSNVDDLRELVSKRNEIAKSLRRAEEELRAIELGTTIESNPEFTVRDQRQMILALRRLLDVSGKIIDAYQRAGFAALAWKAVQVNQELPGIKVASNSTLAIIEALEVIGQIARRAGLDKGNGIGTAIDQLTIEQPPPNDLDNGLT